MERRLEREDIRENKWSYNERQTKADWMSDEGIETRKWNKYMDEREKYENLCYRKRLIVIF